MGRRHLQAYAELRKAGLLRAELVAVLDLDADTAEQLADKAEQLLERRPAVHCKLANVLDDPGVQAIDLVTDPRTHHTLAVPALAAGVHVLCEKPLGLTVRACRLMLDAAERSGAILATAENYRRGGANRLARAALEAGLLGDIHLMVEEQIGGNDQILISEWRHLKEAGAISLDMGCHLTDIVEYYLGPIAVAWGRGLIAEPVRRNTEEGTAITATGEDSLVAQLRTESDVDVHFTYLPSGPGRQYTRRSVHGRLGSMSVPPDRSDGAVTVHTRRGTLAGDALVEALADRFALDEVTLALLGPDGSGGPGAPFAAVDAGYIGVEIADFIDAVLDRGRPEVDGLGGLRAVAGVYAILESGVLGRPVGIDEILGGSVHAYQDEIDSSLGLIAAAKETIA
jgi:predicted dehydrogenase